MTKEAIRPHFLPPPYRGRKSDRWLQIQHYHIVWCVDPQQPYYQDWCLVQIYWTPANDDGSLVAVGHVAYRRSLTPKEVRKLTSRRLFWGHKVPDLPWQFVATRYSRFARGAIIPPSAVGTTHVGV
jgi:hypothetical protein